MKRLILSRAKIVAEKVKKKDQTFTASRWKQFERMLDESCNKAALQSLVGRTENPLFWKLKQAFVSQGIPGLDKEMKFRLKSFLFNLEHHQNMTPAHRAMANLHNPEEWFPATRALQRTIHLHVGPTNSGKTYHALQALTRARSGVYAGPLRLLAHEVYTRFQTQGIPIALVTGEEQRFPDADNYLVACTVEMSPLNQMLDVAVIDEIQMIADSDRGWAWTQAVLGLMAKELHLCGEERAVPIIQAICAKTGDKVEIHRYKRLNQLIPLANSLQGDFSQLQPGDAIVAFSRVGLWALKKQVEKETGRLCAIVYGGLPPETRAQQAALFNDPNNNYDYIVASDAIGMGLNLSIRRVIFETVHKHDGSDFRSLTVAELKQIGGRAGRYRTASQQGDSTVSSESNVGYVMALEQADSKTLVKGFGTEPDPINRAVITIPTAVVERFSKYFPENTPLSLIILRLRDLCSTSSLYTLANLAEQATVADLIHPFPMSVSDRMVFLASPVNLRDGQVRMVLQAIAKAVCELHGGHLLEIEGLELDLLEETPPILNALFLARLESLHRALGLYLWFSYRYPNIIISQALAFHAKSMLEAKIDDLLQKMSFDQAKMSAYRQDIRRRVQQRKETQNILLGQEQEEEDTKPRHEIPGIWNEEGHEEPILQERGETVLLRQTNR